MRGVPPEAFRASMYTMPFRCAPSCLLNGEDTKRQPALQSPRTGSGSSHAVSRKLRGNMRPKFSSRAGKWIWNYLWSWSDPELVNALEELEPHGMGNPAPLFAMRGVRFNLARIFGKEQNHLKLEFENGLEGIWWRGAQHFAEISGGKKKPPEIPGRLWIWFSTLGWNSFHRKTMLEIRDLRKAFLIEPRREFRPGRRRMPLNHLNLQAASPFPIC